MHEHGVDDDFLRHAQEDLVEGAHEHGGILAQVNDLDQGLGMKHRRVSGFGLDRGHALADKSLALMLGRNDLRRANDIDQGVGIGDLEGAGSHEAMAEGLPAGLEPGELEVDDLGTEKGDYPADGAHEAIVDGAPTLRTRPGQALDNAFEHRRKQLGDRNAGDALACVHVAVLDVQIIRGKALAASEADGGLGGIALLIEGDLGAGTLEKLLGGLGGLGDVLHHKDQTTRRIGNPDFAMRDARLVQKLGCKRFELFDGGVEVESGNLLDADFKCEGFASHVLLAFLCFDANDVLQIGCAARLRKGAHAQDVAHALGGADDATSIQEVEGVRALENVVVRGQGQAGLKHTVALSLVAIELTEQKVGVGHLEVVSRELTLVFKEDIAVSEHGAVGAARPHQVVNGIDALDVHRKTLSTVGDLGRNRVALEAADLLEISELGYFHAVEPDFPAQAPSAKRRAFPVVLDEADVVLFRVDADRAQGTQIQVLNVVRRGLHDHLELVVMLHAIGVLAVATVGRTAARLNVGRAPGAGAQGTKGRCGMERARPHLVVVRLHDNATLIRPIMLQRQDHVLERQHITRWCGAHLCPFFLAKR